MAKEVLELILSFTNFAFSFGFKKFIELNQVGFLMNLLKLITKPSDSAALWSLKVVFSPLSLALFSFRPTEFCHLN